MEFLNLIFLNFSFIGVGKLEKSFIIFYFLIFYRLNEKIKNEIVLSENDNNKKFSDVFNEEMEILNKFLNVYKSRKIFDVNDENNQILLKTYLIVGKILKKKMIIMNILV